MVSADVLEDNRDVRRRRIGLMKKIVGARALETKANIRATTGHSEHSAPNIIVSFTERLGSGELSER
jgi:hypothetical protein